MLPGMRTLTLLAALTALGSAAGAGRVLCPLMLSMSKHRGDGVRSRVEGIGTDGGWDFRR